MPLPVTAVFSLMYEHMGLAVRFLGDAASAMHLTPIMTKTRPKAKVRLPIQSIGARLRMPRSWSFRYDHTVPNRPKGTETRKTNQQLIGASSPPRTSPMKDPLMPATLLIPSASPR